MIEVKIISIHGVVVEVQFPDEQTPKVYDALILEDKKIGRVIFEVEAIVSPGRVKAVAFANAIGIKRGVKVINTGKPVEVPVGDEILGRIFNVNGQTIDERGELKSKKYMPIHNPAPLLKNQS